jgi:hypothetical protein
MKREDGNFTFCGKQIVITDRGITVNQAKAVDTLDTLDFPGDAEREITEEERSEYRSAVGKLMWLQGQSRPDLSFGTSRGAQSTCRAKVSDARAIDQVVARARAAKDYSLLFMRDSVDMSKVAIVCYGDAAFANVPDANSQYGVVAVLADTRGCKDMWKQKPDQMKSVPLFWKSATVKRKVRATMAAEAYAISEAAECAELARMAR